MAKNGAGCWEARATTGQIRQISFGEQALPRRHHRGWSLRDHNWCVHDVPRAHRLLSPRSVSVQRHDLGHDVRAARAGRRRTDRVDHGARLVRTPPGETADHEINDLRLDEPRLLFARTRSQSMGGRDIFVLICFTIYIQGVGRPRANRCWLTLRVVARPWKSAMSLCWPTQPRGSLATKAANRGDKSVSSCGAQC